MKKILFLIVLVGAISLGYAQKDTDLMRYSQLNLGGDARFTAMGGAFGALGANASALGVNPAGLGIYSKNEVSFSMALNQNVSNTRYFNTPRESWDIQFNIPQFSGVITIFEGSQLAADEWRRVQFAFGMNRTNDFNSTARIEGFNTSSSYVQSVVNDANGTHYNQLDPFYAELFYYSWLIDTVQGQNNKYKTFLEGGRLMQKKNITTRGSSNEVFFSFGGNFSDYLYVGATIGVPVVRYEEYSIYSEENTEGTDYNPSFRSFQLAENLETRGTGINLKLGMIYKPLDFFRVGLAFHTPTYYSMTDRYRTSLTYTMGGVVNESKDSPSGSYNYEMITPSRAIGSVAFVIGRYGLLSADYEYIDYSRMRMIESSSHAWTVNDVVHDNYRSTGNIRLGTEWRLSTFSLRGGYAYQGSPYKNSTINNWSNHSVSFGIGFKSGATSFDLSYVRQLTSQDYHLYSLPDQVVPFANLSQTKSVMNFTVVTRF